MSNEVEIVVKSTDRTDFAAVAAKARAEMGKSAKAATNDVDKIVTGRFGEIGDHAGQQLSGGLIEHLKTFSRDVGGIGEDAGRSFGDGFTRDAQGRLRDARGRFAGTGKEIGEGIGKSVSGGAKKGFEDLEKTGVRSSKKVASSMTSQLQSAAKTISGAGTLGLIGAGIIALPSIASVAGGGISLALGGALAAVGIKAQMSNKQVQDSFAQTKSYVVQQVKQMSTPFNNTLLSMSKNAQKAFADIEPAVKSSFDSIAPAITNFGDDAERSVGKLNPAIRSVGSGFSAVLNSLGDRLPSIMNNFGTSVKAITDAVAANPGAVTGFVENISKLARVTGDGIGLLIRYKDAVTGVSGVFNSLKATVTGSDTALQIGGGSFATFGQQAALAAAKTRGVMTAQEAATLTSQQLASALQNLTGAAQGSFDAQTSYGRALMAANKRARETSAGISSMTKAGSLNRDMLSALAVNIKNVEAKSHPTAAAIETMRNKFVAAARGMGLSKSAAQALATQMLGVKRAADSIPRSHSTKLSSNAKAAISELRSYQAWINRLHGKSVYVHTVYTSSGSRTFGAGNKKLGDAHGGIIGHAAEGGPRANTTLVGENGPELVDLPAGSRVRSNPDSRRLAAAGGGGGGGGAQTIGLEVIGGSGGNLERMFVQMIRDFVRVTRGSSPDSVQKAFGG